MNIARSIVTLEQFIIERENEFSFASGELSQLLRDIGLAARIVNREVNKAGLVDILGITGDTNVQGEEVKKLDIFANEQFIQALSAGGATCMIASEENEDFIKVDSPVSKDAKYIVLIDPLDGSSNIDVNVSIGTIFSIHRRDEAEGEPGLKDCLQKGIHQVAAGYVIYGSSTMLVYTTGFGVNGFTLDPSIGEFFLSHRNMQIPDKVSSYSVNEGNYFKFDYPVRRYLAWIKEKDKDSGRPYNARYIGSMVADLHRIMLKGGIFLYPALSDAPKGKLRLLYEGNPMAMIIEQAGGEASDGFGRILEIEPTELHQRTPIYMGSKKGVKEIKQFLQGQVTDETANLLPKLRYIQLAQNEPGMQMIQAWDHDTLQGTSRLRKLLPTTWFEPTGINVQDEKGQTSGVYKIREKITSYHRVDFVAGLPFEN
jgi:fructose-1,6-bisphosphatase I